MGTASKEIDVAGVSVGALTLDEWVEHLTERLAAGRHHHVSLNAAKWVRMRDDPELCAAVRAAGSVAADGVGIVLASRWLGRPLPERVPGVDLAVALLGRAAARGWRVVLVGAEPDVVRLVAAKLTAEGVSVVLARDGYFPLAADRTVAEAIGAVRPDLCLLALGTPRAERFAFAHADLLQAGLILGVGGTFDVLAGRVPRAPVWVGRAGLEWAWRWAGAPRARFRRAIVDSVRFVIAMARNERIGEPGVR